MPWQPLIHWLNYLVWSEIFLIADNRKNKFNIVDVCGDMMAGAYISRQTGYIESPDYPDVYPPDVSCSCNLTTTDPDASIYLNVVDINLERPVSI